jgi:hypothetical protein
MHSICGEPVDRGCFHNGVPGAAQGVVALIVGEKEKDVWQT